MIHKIITTLILLFCTTTLFACLHTYQFKIFPVGIKADTILAVDIKIRRTSEAEGCRELKLEIGEENSWNKMWIITGFISKYDHSQNLVEKQSIGMTYAIGEHYLYALEKIYSKGYKILVKSNPKMELFKPSTISFCDFQQSCELVQSFHKEDTKEDFLLYQKKNYPIQVFQDTSYYGFDGKRNLSFLSNISSVRVYKANNLELVISHLATGHEISMGWVTDDPKIVAEKQSKNETAILAKEHIPEFDFSEIHKSIYEEPLLHHGYGVDVFVVKKVK